LSQWAASFLSAFIAGRKLATLDLDILLLPALGAVRLLWVGGRDIGKALNFRTPAGFAILAGGDSLCLAGVSANDLGGYHTIQTLVFVHLPAVVGGKGGALQLIHAALVTIRLLESVVLVAAG